MNPLLYSTEQPMHIATRSRGYSAVLVGLISYLISLAAFSEVPARFYWKTLSNTNAIPVIASFMDGNSNPLDPSHTVTPNTQIEGKILTAGYGKVLPLWNRSAMVAVLVPMGSLTSDVTFAGLTAKESSSGFGDPLLEFNINLIGPPSIRNIPDLQRYEPGFSLDLIVDLALPIGEYDKNQTLNLGQNRTYGRIGAPIVWQLGAWVPGRRTTLELLPSVWLFGNNDEFDQQTLETDPSFEMDVHLTRDFTDTLWGSLDLVYMNGGDSKIDGTTVAGTDSTTLGFTLGYALSDSLQLTVGYKSTIDDGPGDLEMSAFSISLVAGWHRLIEGVKRLGE